jgi:phosphate transport system substrate-binding protein
MKKQVGLVWILTTAMVLGMATWGWSAALDAFNNQTGTIRISGGTAHIPVMKAAAERIMRNHPDIHISIAGGGSGVGIKQVGEGLVDIGNSGRTPSDAEVRKYDLKMFKWALDGVGVVVNPQNPVRALTTAQLKEVFAGNITNWKQLGGSDKGIDLYTRDEASGTREVFWKKALGKGDISSRANVVPSNGAMKTAIANDPLGIGFISVGHIDATVTPVALDGVAPTLDTVRQGTYKVARGLYSNTKGDPTGLVRKFIDYLLSPEGQQLAAQKGFIGVR